jgi:hypothetical protein
MPKSHHRSRAQLTLATEPRKAQPRVAPTLNGIVEGLAELLLDAAQAERPTRQGDFHERPDHHCASAARGRRLCLSIDDVPGHGQSRKSAPAL